MLEQVNLIDRRFEKDGLVLEGSAKLIFPSASHSFQRLVLEK